MTNVRVALTEEQRQLIIDIVRSAEIVRGLAGRSEAIRAAVSDTGLEYEEIAAFCPMIRS